ncbi:MAG: hypothetical protein NXH97_08020 [Rhodobacteraceae bacterium]|nr:hypothetical protein [Paracoccaceae bacterium]
MNDRRLAPGNRPASAAPGECAIAQAGPDAVLPDWIVTEALRSAAVPLDPGDPDHDQFVDAELEKLVALLRWCDDVGVEFWRNEDVPLLKRIAMTSGEETLTLRRMLQDAKKALAERRGHV